MPLFLSEIDGTFQVAFVAASNMKYHLDSSVQLIYDTVYQLSMY